MGHPAIENLTLFHFEPVFIADEEMRPLFVGTIKATFRIQPSEYGPLIPMGEQVPLVVQGKFNGDPDSSSYLLEPECSPPKLATDVVLIGTAKAPQENLTQFDVGLRVGSLTKVAKIFGDRVWYRNITGMEISSPKVVREMPLIYENAFGGVDKTIETKFGFPMEPRNPLGKGYHHKNGERIEGAPLPNIEDPSHLIRHYCDTPYPMGFGFIHSNWQPRAALAGTYDEEWQENRSPLLPKDFDQRFYNSASTGLTAAGYLMGDESVELWNASPWPKLTFRLPGITAPTMSLEFKNGQTKRLTTALDTVIIDTNNMLLYQLYRCRQILKTGPHDVAEIQINSSQNLINSTDTAFLTRAQLIVEN